jgi:hypothetical protein
MCWEQNVYLGALKSCDCNPYLKPPGPPGGGGGRGPPGIGGGGRCGPPVRHSTDATASTHCERYASNNVQTEALRH